MARRKSKAGGRSASNSRGSRGGSKKTGGGAHTRSLSASRRAGSNTRGGASNRGRQIRRGRSTAHASSAVKLLKQDHRAVAQALEEFESAAHARKQAIAQHICKMLTVHTQIEEELLYPAAREALDSDDVHLVAEARVEHTSVKDLIQQIEQAKEVDEEYEAKVQVMGEFVKHHVKEEETELFPKLERSSLDLDALGERLQARKSELLGEEPEGPQAGDGMREEDESGMSSGRSRGGRAQRASALHARRR
jgi:hemerythrin superfamily protein